MSICEQIQQRLSVELWSRNESEVRRHVRECGDCSRFLRDLEIIEDWTRVLSSDVRLPSHFEDRLLRRVPKSSWARSLALHCALPVVLFAAATLGLVVTEQVDSFGSKPVSFSQQTLPVETEPFRTQTADPAYVDVVLEDPEEGEYILRLPSVIEVDRSGPEQSFYTVNVSH